MNSGLWWQPVPVRSRGSGNRVRPRRRNGRCTERKRKSSQDRLTRSRQKPTRRSPTLCARPTTTNAVPALLPGATPSAPAKCGSTVCRPAKSYCHFATQYNPRDPQRGDRHGRILANLNQAAHGDANTGSPPPGCGCRARSLPVLAGRGGTETPGGLRAAVGAAVSKS